MQICTHNKISPRQRSPTNPGKQSLIRKRSHNTIRLANSVMYIYNEMVKL